MLRLTISMCVLLLACGDDSSPGTDAGSDVGTTDATTDAASDVGTSDSGGDDAGGDDAGGENSGGEDAGGDAGELTPCGARLGDTCEDNEFCDFPDDICGAADGTGVCRPRPGDCPDIYMPVCACNGEVQSSACDANAVGFDVNRLGGCTPPADMFACGFLFCSTTQYCRVIIDDTGMPPAYECGELPSECDEGVDCDCVADELCGDMCEADDDDNLTVTCPGG